MKCWLSNKEVDICVTVNVKLHFIEPAKSAEEKKVQQELKKKAETLAKKYEDDIAFEISEQLEPVGSEKCSCSDIAKCLL